MKRGDLMLLIPELLALEPGDGQSFTRAMTRLVPGLRGRRGASSLRLAEEDAALIVYAAAMKSLGYATGSVAIETALALPDLDERLSGICAARLHNREWRMERQTAFVVRAYVVRARPVMDRLTS